jgi:hypothetical protein
MPGTDFASQHVSELPDGRHAAFYREACRMLPSALPWTGSATQFLAENIDGLGAS